MRATIRGSGGTSTVRVGTDDKYVTLEVGAIPHYAYSDLPPLKARRLAAVLLRAADEAERGSK